MQGAAEPPPPICRKAQVKAGDRGGEKAAAFLLPTGKLPPRAPEHATLNRQYLANRGKAGTSPAPGKRRCGRTLTHSPEPNHSSPSAFSVLEKQEEILGLKALAQTATNFDHKTKGGKKKPPGFLSKHMYRRHGAMQGWPFPSVQEHTSFLLEK